MRPDWASEAEGEGEGKTPHSHHWPESDLPIVDNDEDDDFDIDEFVAEANKWDDLYLNSTIHAVELYHRQSQVREVILKFLSRKNRGAFKLTNPFSKRDLASGFAQRVPE